MAIAPPPPPGVIIQIPATRPPPAQNFETPLPCLYRYQEAILATTRELCDDRDDGANHAPRAAGAYILRRRSYTQNPEAISFPYLPNVLPLWALTSRNVVLEHVAPRRLHLLLPPPLPQQHVNLRRFLQPPNIRHPLLVPPGPVPTESGPWGESKTGQH